MSQLFVNNFKSTLGAALASGDTTLTLATGAGARLPVIANPDYARLTLDDGAGAVEIVKATAHASASASVTIERAQEDTPAQAFAAGCTVEMRFTAATAARFDAAAPWLTGSGPPTAATASTLGALYFDRATYRLYRLNHV